MKSITLYLLLISLGWGLISCQKSDIVNIDRSDSLSDSAVTNIKPIAFNSATSKLSETAPPIVIQELNKSFEQIAPQVSLLTPESDRIFEDTTVNVKVKVQNLAIFKDDKLNMGPHLNLILDNEPVREIYNLDEPITLESLTPGTHTIRVFAARPWNESFKNEGAYAQTTFHVLTKTNSNNPDRNIPLITYSHPNGTYSAEPIMLDFYLTNAPLHLVAQENPNDDIKDWHIRITVNGESFILDDWQPIYLQGFNKGNNWIQLELLDEDGNNLENAFNNTVRLVNYEPKEKNTLAKLVTGKISATEARSIVDRDYNLQPTETPEIIEPEVVIEEPAVVTKEKPEVIEEEPVAVTKEKPEVVIEEPAAVTKEKLEVIEEEPVAVTKEEPSAVIEPEISVKDSEDIEPSVTENEIAPEIKSDEAITQPEAALPIAPEVNATVKETDTESKAEEVIATESNSEIPESSVELEIPEVEAVTITEDKIALETSEISTNESKIKSQPKTQFNFSNWIKNVWSIDWAKNVWNNVQQKAQNIFQAMKI